MKLEAKAIFLDIPENDGEFEEYEYDIVWSHEKHTWVQTLKDGRYLLNIKAYGY